MYKTVLIIILGTIPNILFSQIKSEKRIQYWLRRDANKAGFHNNHPKSFCLNFWEVYNQDGKVIIEYDFPADRCWKKHGPWVHYYFYDDRQRIIEHQHYGIENKKELMYKQFYSYPYKEKPYNAHKITNKYNFVENTKAGQEKIIATYLDSTNTEGIYDFFRTGWKYDTLKYVKGNIIYRKDFNRDQYFLNPELLELLIYQKKFTLFENELIQNIDQISDSLCKLYKMNEAYPCEIEFIDTSKTKSIFVSISEYFIELDYKFLNPYGDCIRSINYRYHIPTKHLNKRYIIKSNIKYYE